MKRFAHAILLVGGKYALQLRDDKPGIAAPGTWCLFGGTVNDGESAHDAVIREIAEELTLELQAVRLFETIEAFSESVHAVASYNVFESDCTEIWPRHQLREGRAAMTFSYHELLPLPMTGIMRRILALHHERSRIS